MDFFPISTLNNIPNYTIVKSKGIIYDEEGSESWMGNTVFNLQKEAKKIGSNALINVKIIHAGGKFRSYGEAVIVKKL